MREKPNESTLSCASPKPRRDHGYNLFAAALKEPGRKVIWEAGSSE
jgi:hypothetical protein